MKIFFGLFDMICLLATRGATAGAEVHSTNLARHFSDLNCTPNLFLHPILCKGAAQQSQVTSCVEKG